MGEVKSPRGLNATLSQHQVLRVRRPRASWLRSGWPGDKEAGWVKTYDPGTRMVVFIMREDHGVSSYFLIPPTPPAQAYADQQAQGN